VYTILVHGAVFVYRGGGQAHISEISSKLLILLHSWTWRFLHHCTSSEIKFISF